MFIHSVSRSVSVWVVIVLALGAFATGRARAESLAATESVPGAEAYAGEIQVTRLLRTQVDAAGRKIEYPTGGAAEITALLVEVPPGGRTGWHKHPLPCIGYMLEGELHVTLIDGRVNVFRAGEALAETVELEHEGVNPGPGVARLVMFVLGTEGAAFTVKTPEPEAAVGAGAGSDASAK